MNAKIIKTSLSAPTDPTAQQEPRTTFARNKPSATAGFTLVEILMVLAIIAAVMALGLPALSRVTYQKVNSTTRKFVGVVRTVRNDAVLLTSIYRLAFDLEKRTWWVESQRELRTLDAPDPDAKRDKDGEAPPSNFSMVEKYGTKPTPLPSGVAIAGVFKEDEGLIKQGIAYIHFFPNGFNEQAILYIVREGEEVGKGYSVVVRATSGRVEIYPSYVQNLDGSL